MTNNNPDHESGPPPNPDRFENIPAESIYSHAEMRVMNNSALPLDE